jgi:putative ABC transport system permease protein
MIRNYLVIAWRSVLKNRLFSFINIFSLALSLSVCMMVMVRLMDALSFDRFHPEPERTYRIISEINNLEGKEWTLASTPLPLRAILEGDSNLFESTVSLYPALHDNATDGVKEIFLNGAFTQSSFFEVFGFSLVSGDERTALSQPNSIVLSHATAQKFFGETNPVGKLITFEKSGIFQITGVLAEAGKSHIDFDVYLSSSSVEQLEKDRKLPVRYANWDSFEHAYTYAVLHKKLGEENLKSRLGQLSKEINREPTSGRFYFQPQPISSISPATGSIYNDIGRGSSWVKIGVEIGVALIILLAAAFNYTNLSIARSLTRTREVAIRKVAGARRSQIFIQYIVESVLVALFSLGAALVILSFILEFKPFNDGYKFMPAVKLDPFILFCFLIFSLFAGILAGALPAWILSSFRAVKMLRNVAVENIMGGMTLRKVLIVFQFSVSLVVLIFLTAFYRQFSFMADAETGFQRENIVSIQVSTKEKQILSNEISRVSGVNGIAAMSGNFGRYPTGSMPVKVNQDVPQPLKVNFYCGDAGVIPVMGLKLLAGVNFSDNLAVREKEVLLNRKAIQLLGFETPADAAGEKIWIDDTLHVQIAGVVENFYNEGVGNAIGPLAIRNKPVYNYLNIRIEPEAEASIMPQLEQAWKKVFPDRAFAYVWLDKEHEERHSQKGSISLLGFLAFMTVTIASLGLLGLVVYTVETKRKEISIRKIIGASVNQLVVLLSRGFAKLLIIAGLVALPLGYVLSQFFLMNFANRINFGVGALLLAFGFLLFIGLSMIISQTYKASVENPAKNLRSE